MARKNYTDAQKAKILQYAEENSITAASEKYGVDRKTIRGWKVSADVTAERIEAKKKTRGAAWKAKEAATSTAEKVATDVKVAVDEAKLADQMAAGKAKAKRTRKAEEKATTKEQKAAEKQRTAETKAANKRSVKRQTVKMNMVFQSQTGSAITPEQIALKLPKETTDVYVKIEENKAYYVLKDGSTGSVDLWE